jgi:integrase
MATRGTKGDGSIFGTAKTGYRGYLTVEGKRQEFRAKTKREAEQKLKDLIIARDRGATIVRTTPLFDDWLNTWLNDIARLTPLTRQGYEANIRLYIRPHLGHLRLNKIRAEDIEALFTKMRAGKIVGMKGGVGPATIRQCLSIIKRPLSIAVERRYLEWNVAKLVKVDTVPRAEMDVLEKDEVRQLLTAATKITDYRARWVIALMLGLRPGEALGLTWDQINLDKNELYVRQQVQYINGRGIILHPLGKTSASSRTIVMPSFVTALLTEHQATQQLIRRQEGSSWAGWKFAGQSVDLVFSHRDGTPIAPRLDHNYWKKLLIAADLPHTRRYTARHSAATLMLDAIGDVAVVAAALGHSDSSFTMRTYIHAQEAQKIELAKRMEAYAMPDSATLSATL